MGEMEATMNGAMEENGLPCDQTLNTSKKSKEISTTPTQ